MLEIVPQAATLYPNDVQLFTARTGGKPAYWQDITNGTIQSDLKILQTVTTSGQTMTGIGAHTLRSGIGRIKWTIETHSTPTSTGQVKFIYHDSSGETFEIRLLVTSVQVRNQAGLLTTIAETPAAGQTYELEMVGNNWRFYKNGILRYTHIPSAGVEYPGDYTGAIITPVVGSTPRLMAPDLTGDWQLQGGVVWTIDPSHGTSTPDATEPKTTYSGGSRPGFYNLKGQVGTSSFQEATAVITIPPLTVFGPLAITLQPLEKVRFKTNYDAAQTRLVSWAVLSGSGSFSNDTFTAGSAPGTTLISATYLFQIIDITITVPAVITSSVGAAAFPGEVVTFTTNMTGSISWTADHGTASGSGASFLWTAPSVAGPVARITATNGTLTKTLEIPVLEKFPFTDPSLPIVWDRKRTVLISRAEDRSRTTRIKDKGGLPFEAFEFNFTKRSLADLNTINAFWDLHYPGKRWIYEDKIRTIRKVLYFDSDIRIEGEGPRCGIDLSFRAVEG